MRCKFCNTEMEDDRVYCPECGKRQNENAKTDLKAENETGKINTKRDTKNKGNKSNISLVPFIVCIVALILAIVFLVMIIIKDGKREPIKPTPGTTATTNTDEPQETVDKQTFVDAKDKVISTMKEEKLTNGLMQMFFTTELNRFVEEYGSSITQFGLDLSKPLKDQKYPYEGAENWEEFFAELALEQWKNCLGLMEMAKNEGFEFDPDLEKDLDEYIESLEEFAKEDKFESADELIQTYYGAGCNVEVYKAFTLMNTKANEYYYSVLEVTDEEVAAAFPTYKAELEEKEITQTSGVMASVRHILLCPKGGTKSEDGKTIVYSDEDWAACLAEAEKLLDDWKKGEATENTFADMAAANTEDTASISVGGLYEGVSDDGKYVPEFEAWAVDASRKVGDTGIVRTDYGYHIMYYVKGVPEHLYYTKILLQNDRLEDMGKKLEEFLKEYLKDTEVKLDYETACLQNVYME